MQQHRLRWPSLEFSQVPCNRVVVVPSADTLLVKLAPRKLRTGIHSAIGGDVGVTDYVDWIQTGIAIEYVARKSDDEVELFPAIFGKFATLVLWRFDVEVRVDIDATRSIHDLDADGTGIQRHLAVPVALPRVPGATLLVHQLVYSQASTRIGRIAGFRHQIVRADRDLIALCQ